MMERKECVEIDQAQLFQQFNLQADRDRHDLIFDVVEDIARILGREETQYLKTDYDNLRDSLDSVATLAQKFGLFAFGNSPFSQSETCQYIHDWHLQFHVSLASVSINHSDGETHG